jgi:hypothetical protein
MAELIDLTGDDFDGDRGCARPVHQSDGHAPTSDSLAQDLAFVAANLDDFASSDDEFPLVAVLAKRPLPVPRRELAERRRNQIS